jgi:spore germination cell wall hydrolase CwlJ-like protein
MRLNRFLGSRGASAVAAFFMLATASSEVQAQASVSYDVKAAVKALDVDASSKPFGSTQVTTAVSATLPATPAVATVTGSVVQAQPARSVTVSLAPEIAREAAWLHKGGWPLYALVDRYSSGAPLDEQANCIATAVYFEARGEALDGQLAVARVIMNRAASGKYPPSWCGTVKQPWQFSFVRNGRFPTIDYGSSSWRKALGVTRLAISGSVPTLSQDVLWYHADYVAPSWGQRLTRVEKIGVHIFYRA